MRIIYKWARLNKRPLFQIPEIIDEINTGYMILMHAYEHDYMPSTMLSASDWFIRYFLKNQKKTLLWYLFDFLLQDSALFYIWHIPILSRTYSRSSVPTLAGGLAGLLRQGHHMADALVGQEPEVLLLIRVGHACQLTWHDPCELLRYLALVLDLGGAANYCMFYFSFLTEEYWGASTASIQ